MNDHLKTSRPVSVVMATCNGARFLVEQIDSILGQTLKPLELIVCDDRSEDGTIDILEEYRQKGLLEYHINESRLGVIENFKRVVSLASPDSYIALSDQDDVWLPHKLQSLSDRLISLEKRRGESPAMVYSDLTVVNEHREVLNSSFWNELGQDTYRHAFPTLLFGNFVTGCSMMMNPSMGRLFLEMPAGIPMHDAWIALIAYSFGGVDQIAEPLVLYRKHDRNVAHSNKFRKKTKYERWAGELKKLWTENDYLEEQLGLLKLFYGVYKDQLSGEQQQLAERFLKLENKSFFWKKVAFRRFFRGYWV